MIFWRKIVIFFTRNTPKIKQQHVCKEINQYTNNTNRKWFLSFSIEWTIGANDRK